MYFHRKKAGKARETLDTYKRHDRPSCKSVRSTTRQNTKKSSNEDALMSLVLFGPFFFQAKLKMRFYGTNSVSRRKKSKTEAITGIEGKSVGCTNKQ